MKIKNRNDLVLFSIVSYIIVALIILGIVLYNIWRSKEESKITQYSYSGFEDTVVKMYQSQLERILRKSNAKILVSKLDEEYVRSIGLEKNDVDGIISYLNSKHLLSTLPQLLEYEISKNDDSGIYVYSFKYRTNGFIRKVHLIEEEPYVYTISFEQELTPTSAKRNINKTIDGIKFEVTLVESNENSIKYNLKITNQSEQNVKFDFNNISSVELILNDGSNIKIASVIASNEDYLLTPGSYLNQELFFNIAGQNQGNINAINIYNVLVGEDKRNIEINF